MHAGAETQTADQTQAVAACDQVLNNLLSVFELDKLYIPPQLDESQRVYRNQLLRELTVLEQLGLKMASCSPPLPRAKPGRCVSRSAI